MQMAAGNPARIYDIALKGKLTPGYFADIAILDEQIELKALFIRGSMVRNYL